MRILLITATYIPSTNGVAITVENMRKNLEVLGHDVFVLAPKNSKKVLNDHPKVIRFSSVENPVVKDYPIPLLPSYKQISDINKKKKFDLIHVHHPFHIGFFARILSKNFQIPLVFTFHTHYDAYAEKYFEFLPKALRDYFVENTLYDFCKKVDYVIAPSKYIENIIRKKLPQINVSTLPAAVTYPKKSKVSKLNLRRKLNIPENKKLLLTVSRLNIEKDVPVLIKSLSYLPKSFHLVIVGTGLEENNLKKLTKLKNLDSRITFCGMIEHNEIYKYYIAADFFVFASKTETQGLIFLEAQSYGLPIIAVNSGASREWVLKDFGKLSSSSPKDFAQKILEVDSNNYEKMNKEALKNSQKYRSETVFERLTALYKKIVKEYRPDKNDFIFDISKLLKYFN